jgi:hypothetical protein
MGLRYQGKAIGPGAQTERRGEAGPAGDPLGGATPPAGFAGTRSSYKDWLSHSASRGTAP